MLIQNNNIIPVMCIFLHCYHGLHAAEFWENFLCLAKI